MQRPTDPKDRGKWLVVRPLLDRDKQVSDSSVDLRLGTHFTITRGVRRESLDPFEEKVWDDIHSVQRQIMVPFGQRVVLHPGDFILGTTVEYVRMPTDLAAYVTGRSSWGRLGLMIATAVVIHPGFCGCITLELVNEGPVPVVLRPGMRIGQLVVHRVQGKPDGHPGIRYLGQTQSEYSRINEDDEIDILREFATTDDRSDTGCSGEEAPKHS